MGPRRGRATLTTCSDPDELDDLGPVGQVSALIARRGGDTRMSFRSVGGPEPVRSSLTWTPSSEVHWAS